MEHTLKVLLVDDHPLYRRALTPIFNGLAETVVLFEAESLEQAFSFVDEQGRFDLLLLDLNLRDSQGLKTLFTIGQMIPDTPIIVISATESRKLIVHAIKTCAKGFVSKAASETEIRNALTLVLNGGVYIPSVLCDWMTELSGEGGSGNFSSALTQRQDEVLQLLAKGCSNKQIGLALEIAETTVRVHVSDILYFFSANNRTDAVAKAQQLGLLNF